MKVKTKKCAFVGCETLIYNGSTFCRVHCQITRRNLNKGIKTKKCVDPNCNNLICNESERCNDHARLGKLNPNYSHGRHVENCCVDCNKLCSTWSDRCNDCNIKWMVGPNNKHYKLENHNRVCIDCSKSVTMGSINGRCSQCNGKSQVGLNNPSSTPEARRKISLALGGTGIPYETGNYDRSVFNSRLKNKIRTRDNFRCRICKFTNDEHIKKWKCKLHIHIHHISYDKLDCSENNLISLCNSCHGKTHPKSRRIYWQEYFTKLLLEI